MWIAGSELLTDDRVWVPAELAFCGRIPRTVGDRRFLVSTTSGLAARLAREDAVTAALAELIERDAVSCAELRAVQFSAFVLRTLASLFELQFDADADDFAEDIGSAVTVDPDTLPEPAATLYERFNQAGLAVTLKCIPNDLAVPVFGAATIEPLSDEVLLAAAGYGMDLDINRSACRALLELAQSRATNQQGARQSCGQRKGAPQAAARQPLARHTRQTQRRVWRTAFSDNRASHAAR